MKKYLQFLKFAFKEEREYKTNFFTSIIVMIINDICVIAIFLIFLSYFTDTSLTIGNFLIISFFSCSGYGFVYGLFRNIGELPEIIEQGKLDYYLSFPTKLLPFLVSNKIHVIVLGDIIFGLICFFIYVFGFTEGVIGIILLKGVIILIFSIISIIGIYILVGSISFWLQKGSKIQELFTSMFTGFSTYPPEIYNDNKFVYILMCILFFPGIILPYQMIIGPCTIQQWIILITTTFFIFGLGIFVFKKGLKRYSSGNLINQM